MKIQISGIPEPKICSHPGGHWYWKGVILKVSQGKISTSPGLEGNKHLQNSQVIGDGGGGRAGGGWKKHILTNFYVSRGYLEDHPMTWVLVSL